MECSVCGRVVLGDESTRTGHRAACAALQSGRERRKVQPHQSVGATPQQDVTGVALEARGGSALLEPQLLPSRPANQPVQGAQPQPAAAMSEYGRHARLQGALACWCCARNTVRKLTAPASRRVAAGPVPAHHGAGTCNKPMKLSGTGADCTHSGWSWLGQVLGNTYGVHTLG